MKKPILITPQDLEAGQDLDSDQINEKWNICKLCDGTTLEVKRVLTGVKRLEKWNVDVSPVYIINITSIFMVTNVPEDLKAKKKPQPSNKSD